MTTFTAQVSASGRDAQQVAVGNAAVINDATIQTAGRAYWGLAWLNVTIPQGSFIGRVIIETYGYTKYPSMSTTIYGEAANNATVYAATTNNLSNRTRTTANVAHTATYAADGWQSTVDLRAVVQEIVNRAGWASGNALSTIWLNNTSSPGATATAYDGVAASAPKITIDYYSGQGSAVTGIGVTVGVGTPTVTTPLTVGVSGIGVTAGAGTPTVLTPLTVSVSGIGTTVGLGTPTITTPLTVGTSGIGVTVDAGTPTVLTPLTVSVSGIGTTVGVGTPTINQTAPTTSVSVAGIGITTTIGTPTATPGIVTAAPTGIGMTVTVGTPTLTGAYTANVAGIPVVITAGVARGSLLPATRNIVWFALPASRRWAATVSRTRWVPNIPATRWESERAER